MIDTQDLFPETEVHITQEDYARKARECQDAIERILSQNGVQAKVSAQFFSCSNVSLFGLKTSELKRCLGISSGTKEWYGLLPPLCLRAKTLATEAMLSFLPKDSRPYDMKQLTRLYAIISKEVYKMFLEQGVDLHKLPFAPVPYALHILDLRNVYARLGGRIDVLSEAVLELSTYAISLSKVQDFINENPEKDVSIIRDLLYYVLPDRVHKEVRKLSAARKEAQSVTHVHGDQNNYPNTTSVTNNYIH